MEPDKTRHRRSRRRYGWKPARGPAKLRSSRSRRIRPSPHLLSAGELAFFRVLREAIDPCLTLSLKTRLVDIVGCPDRLWNKPHGRRLAQKHVDFVLVDPCSGRIVAVVELDDRTHDLPARRERDRFVNEVLDRAGVPLIRVRAARQYDMTVLRRQLAWALRRSDRWN